MEQTPNVSDIQNEAGSQGEVSNANEDVKNSVAYETYSRLLSQHKKTQASLKEFQQQMAMIQAEKEAVEKASMEEQSKFKELYQKEASKVSEMKKSLEQFQEQVSNQKKLDALKRELGGVRRDEYLQFANVNEISLNDDGSIDHDSLQEVAAKFRLNHADLLIQQKTVPNVDAKQNNIAGKLSYDEWMRLPLSEQKKRMKDIKE